MSVLDKREFFFIITLSGRKKDQVRFNKAFGYQGNCSLHWTDLICWCLACLSLCHWSLVCTWISWYWNKWEDMSGCGWQGLALRQLSCMNVSTEAFFFCVLVCSIPFRALIWKLDYINANSHTLPGSGKVLMLPHFDSLISLDSFRFHSISLSACPH